MTASHKLCADGMAQGHTNARPRGRFGPREMGTSARTTDFRRSRGSIGSWREILWNKRAASKEKAREIKHFTENTGAPERIRTSDLCLRRAALYPTELRVPKNLIPSEGRLRNAPDGLC